ncbi:MAG TPA: thiamine pyrophosphate-dependent enzyme, partial [Candidatus Bathyarchaeia archaeon]|nr:thiamine pyrophosphate-dependent enzyme [Candidatus Bathyarchaeia archaeon]
RNWKNRYPVILDDYWKTTNGVNTYALIATLSELLDQDTIVVPGSSGTCSEMTLQSFQVKKGQRVLNSPGLGSMGFGMVAAIGACLASGKRPTVCIIGDGGLQHNIQEMELLHRYQLPVKIFVLNNNAYASIRTTQLRHCGGNLVACDPSSGLTLPDTLKVADAYGVKSARILNPGELKRTVAAVLKVSGPVICEVMIDPETTTAPRMASQVNPDGSIVSKPFEDLWPFLDREEFQANMNEG